MSPADRQRPLLIFDGDCRFCTAWVHRWRGLTGDRVDYAPFQEVGERFPEISPEAFERSVQLVLPSGEVISGARAVFRILGEVPGYGWLLWAHERVPGFAGCSEAAYRLVAGRRQLAARVSRRLWGEPVPVAGSAAVRRLLLRGLGVVYLCAFASLWLQIPGLIGDEGILPVGRYLDAVGRQLGWRGFWYAPTLAWLRPDTAFLEAMAACGAVAAVLVVWGVLTLPALVLCWVVYLSLVAVGQDFLAFQWDVLLLEAGFLAMFLASRRPWGGRSFPGLGRFPGLPPGGFGRPVRESPAAIFVWLYRLLLFRLVFSSGVVKLLSGDPVWRDLTALGYHFETQPLPTPPAWYAHQLPEAVLRLSTGAMFAVELVVPFLYLAPRRPRILAAGITVAFQAAIAATGNYAFFNLLTVILCVALLDDAFLRKLLPASMVAGAAPGRTAGPTDEETSAVDGGARPGVRHDPRCPRRPALPWRGAVAVVVVVLGLTQLAGLFVAVDSLPPPLPGLHALTSPLHLVNGYGLFAVMTKARPEIVVEGSRDGEAWRPYRFRYKPQDLARAPRWVAPHQPRLDWQMWFAALGGPRRNPWFIRFAARLLEGSPEVLALLETNPFPDRPPELVRATLYRYRFTEVGGEERWWRRERLRTYLPPVSSDDLR